MVPHNVGDGSGCPSQLVVGEVVVYGIWQLVAEWHARDTLGAGRATALTTLGATGRHEVLSGPRQ